MASRGATTVTLQEAAERLGVHYMTAYRYVRTGLLEASKEGATWRVSVEDLERFRQRDAAPSRNRKRTRAGYPERLADRLLVGDEAGATELIDATLASGAGLEEVYLDLLVPALTTIGDRWAKGEITVAAEHQASAVALRLLGNVGPRFRPRGRRRGTVVVGAAPEDQHGLPSALLADLLRLRRFEVIDLGANPPPEAFADASTARDRLLAVGICATVPGDEQVTAAVGALRAAGIDVPVLVGGAAVEGPDHAGRLGADGWSGTGREAVEAFEAAVSPSA